MITLSLRYWGWISQVQCVDLNEIVQFVIAVINVISVPLNLSTLFVASHVLSAEVSSGTQKWCIPSIEVTDTKFMGTFFPGPNVVSFEWRCPFNRGVPKERFHGITTLTSKFIHHSSNRNNRCTNHMRRASDTSNNQLQEWRQAF